MRPWFPPTRPHGSPSQITETNNLKEKGKPVEKEEEPEPELEPEVLEMLKTFNLRGLVRTLETATEAKQKVILLRMTQDL